MEGRWCLFMLEIMYMMLSSCTSEDGNSSFKLTSIIVTERYVNKIGLDTLKNRGLSDIKKKLLFKQN